jgi:oxalate decarboxylase/phosphoglucose isomerase-like protein (cupin superfamily)
MIKMKEKLSVLVINLTPGYGHVSENTGIAPLFLMSELDGGLPNT